MSKDSSVEETLNVESLGIDFDKIWSDEKSRADFISSVKDMKSILEEVDQSLKDIPNVHIEKYQTIPGRMERCWIKIINLPENSINTKPKTRPKSKTIKVMEIV